MKGVCCILLFSIGAVWLPSCSVFTGTPMPGSERCRYLPTSEGCETSADSHIEDQCLRACVHRLCKEGKPHCDGSIRVDCVLRTQKHEEGDVGGYVYLQEEPRSCRQPSEDVEWCERP